MPPDAAPEPRDQITWALLLAHWTRMAESAVALPDDGEGGLWKRSIPDAIGLHALACALAECHTLVPDERAVAIDRGALQIESHERTLIERWGSGMPEGLAELVADARRALDHARGAGDAGA